jgi:WD40 repeat protein
VAAGLAAGLAVLLLAVALPLTLRGRGPDPQHRPTATPSPSASAMAAGIRLVYLRLGSGESDTTLMTFDLGQPGPKTLNDHVKSAANVSVSPDGRKLAVITADGLFISDIDGSGQRKLRSNVAGMCGRDWLPDSTQLLISDNTTGMVMRIDATAGAVKSLNFTPGGCNMFANSMAISADGKQIANYSFPPRVVIFDIDGAELRSFATSGSPRSFSPDGNLLILEKATGSGCTVLDLRTGAEQELSVPGAGRLQWAYFTPDGRILAEYGGADLPVEYLFFTADGHQLARMARPAALDGAVFTGTFLTA